MCGVAVGVGGVVVVGSVVIDDYGDVGVGGGVAGAYGVVAVVDVGSYVCGVVVNGVVSGDVIAIGGGVVDADGGVAIGVDCVCW